MQGAAIYAPFGCRGVGPLIVAGILLHTKRADVTCGRVCRNTARVGAPQSDEAHCVPAVWLRDSSGDRYATSELRRPGRI